MLHQYAALLAVAVLLCLGAADAGTERGRNIQDRRLAAVQWNETGGAAASSGRVGAAIAYGLPAAKTDFPYIAYLFNGKGGMGCAGSLIHPRVVLTAAHCLFKRGSTSHDSNPTFVRVGLWQYFNDRDVEPPPYEERNVVFTAMHPSYSTITKSLDLALLILDKPVNRTRPVALAPLNMRLAAGAPLWAAGWGTTHIEDENVDTLMKVRLPYVTNARCAALRVPRPPSHICAGGGAGKGDTCAGDSGGPLVKKAKGAGDVLVGITSYGPVAKCGRASTGAYTFVGHPAVRQFITWALQGL